jgi:WhiB family redox-sensing transcriptional regulator
MWLMDAGRGEQLPSLEEFLLRPGWMELAACAGAPIETFFPPRGASVAPARAICAGCPVQTECREYAHSGEHLQGIWGGESERQRKRARVPYSCPVATVAKLDTALTCINISQNVVGSGLFTKLLDQGPQGGVGGVSTG